MELHREEIEAAGLRIVALGLGEPKHARQFGDKLAPNVDCLTNEEPTLHAAFGIERGNILRLMAPDAIRAGARAASRGHSQGQATGDAHRVRELNQELIACRARSSSTAAASFATPTMASSPATSRSWRSWWRGGGRMGVSGNRRSS